MAFGSYSDTKQLSVNVKESLRSKSCSTDRALHALPASGHKKVELSGGQHLIMKQGPGWVVMSLMVEGAIAFIAV